MKVRPKGCSIDVQHVLRVPDAGLLFGAQSREVGMGNKSEKEQDASVRLHPWIGRAAAVLGLLVAILALATLWCYSEERQFLEQAVQEEDKVGWFSYQVISTGTLVSLVVFMVLLFGLNRAAGERQRAEETLSASEVRYRRLFETARDGILLLDAETGMVVDVNPFLVEMLGFAREVFLSRKIWELGFFKDIVANQANFAELQEKGYIRYEDKPLETADGRRIEVADTGTGILPEHLPRVMESFFTTKEEGKGTGLGLAICRRIAKEHGGSIHLESEMGKGTTVRVVLPLDHHHTDVDITTEEKG